MANQKQLRFQVDAALLFELGEQLVARKSVALAELIKNSYDADATEVVVAFDGVKTEGGTITLSDNGAGMTLQDVQDHWMRIATTAKRSGQRTIRGRYPTGAKGVGRFAVRKLASRLRLESVANGPQGRERVIARFDWSKFQPGMSLSSIESPVETRPDQGATGTTLVLEGVRDAWEDDDLADVRRDLQDLTPPFTTAGISAHTDGSLAETSNFSVRFIAPEFPAFEGYLSEQFLSAAVARLSGYVDEEGRPQYSLALRGRVGDVALSPPDKEFEDIHGASFVVHYFKYDSASLRDFDIGAKEARAYGQRFGGVKIYLDGFRVFPYGDAGDDWLNLDAERGRRLTRVDEVLRKLVPTDPGSRPMLAMPGNNNLFGGVFISREAQPGLQPTISRERIVENQPFAQLVDFVRLGVDWMVLERARQDEFRRRSEEGSAGQAHGDSATASESVADAIREVELRLRNLPISRDTRQIAALLERMQEAVVRRERRDLDKIGMLRILASAGTMVVIFVHQIRAVLDGLRGTLRDLGEVGSGIPPDFDDSIDEMRTRLRDWTNLLDAQGQHLGLLLGREARQRRRRLALTPVMDQMRATFQSYTTTLNVTIEDEFEAGLRTPPMFEAELHSILLNLLTNSIKAVRQEPTRRILVTARRDGAEFVMAVRDTGHGVRPDQRSRLFEPFETTSVPDPVLGTGTGVGLTIVRDIVEEHDGTVQFAEPDPPWHTEVRIQIPWDLPA